MRAFLIFILSALSVFGQLPPYQRNFFDTNTAPIVQVAPGTNITVVYSTTEPAGQVRTFTVHALGSSGAATNVWRVSSSNQTVLIFTNAVDLLYDLTVTNIVSNQIESVTWYLMTNSLPTFATNLGVPIDGYTQGLAAVTIGNTNYFKMLVGGENYGIKVYSNGPNSIILSNLYPNIWWFTNPVGPTGFQASPTMYVAAGSISNNYNVAIRGLLQLYGYDSNTTPNAFNAFNEFRTSGNNWSNTFMGRWAGRSNDTGAACTFIGYLAGHKNRTGTINTYIGAGAGENSETVGFNTALGYQALTRNASGNGGNTALGERTMHDCVTAANNVAVGDQTLYAVQSSDGNTAIGFQAALGLIGGPGNNTIVGTDTMRFANYPSYNVIMGYRSGYSIEGSNNVAVGNSTLVNNTGVSNCAVGNRALEELQDTAAMNNGNTALGACAGRGIYYGNHNLLLGENMGIRDEGPTFPYTLNSNIMIGVFGSRKAHFNGTNDWYFEPNMSTPLSMYATQSLNVGYYTMSPFTNVCNTNSFESVRVPATNITFRFLIPSNYVRFVYTNFWWPYSNSYPTVQTNYTTQQVFGVTGDALINVPFYTASPSTNAPAWNEFVTRDYVDTHGGGTGGVAFNTNFLLGGSNTWTGPNTFSGSSNVLYNWTLMGNGSFVGGSGMFISNFGAYNLSATNLTGPVLNQIDSAAYAAANHVLTNNYTMVSSNFVGNGSNLVNLSLTNDAVELTSQHFTNAVGDYSMLRWQHGPAGLDNFDLFAVLDSQTNFGEFYFDATQMSLDIGNDVNTNSIFMNVWRNEFTAQSNLFDGQIWTGPAYSTSSSSSNNPAGFELVSRNYVDSQLGPFLTNSENRSVTFSNNFLVTSTDHSNSVWLNTNGSIMVSNPSVAFTMGSSGMAANNEWNFSGLNSANGRGWMFMADGKYLTNFFGINFGHAVNSELGLVTASNHPSLGIAQTHAPPGFIIHAGTNTGYGATLQVTSNLTVNGSILSSISNRTGLRLDNWGTALTTNLLEIYSNGIPLFVVRSNGNVGINTASPAYPLDVSGAITASGQVRGDSMAASGSSPTLYLYDNSYAGTADDYYIWADNTNFYARLAPQTPFLSYTGQTSTVFLSNNVQVAGSLTVNGGGSYGAAVTTTSSSTNTPAINELVSRGYVDGAVGALAGFVWYGATNVNAVNGNCLNFSTVLPAHWVQSFVLNVGDNVVGVRMWTNQENKVAEGQYTHHVNVGQTGAGTVTYRSDLAIFTATTTNVIKTGTDVAIVGGITNEYDSSSFVVTNTPLAAGEYLGVVRHATRSGGTATIYVHGGNGFPTRLEGPSPTSTTYIIASDATNAATTVFANSYTLGTFQSNTCGTATFDFSKPRQFTNTTTDVTFSAVTGQHAVDVRTVSLTITNSSNTGIKLLTIPGTWTSPTNVYPVTNVGILSVESWGTYMTNAVYRGLK